MAGRPMAQLNALLEDNACFGCGPANQHGLRLELLSDGERVIGTFRPLPEHATFGRLFHPGLQNTVMECMASWIVRELAGRVGLPVGMTQRLDRPALVGEDLMLDGHIESREGDSVKVAIQVHNTSGQLLTEASFDYKLLPAETVRMITRLNPVPAHLERYLRD
ncbi:MAG: PaaI family thioesterase [Candidatus Dormibacteria bacterium]